MVLIVLRCEDPSCTLEASYAVPALERLLLEYDRLWQAAMARAAETGWTFNGASKVPESADCATLCPNHS